MSTSSLQEDKDQKIFDNGIKCVNLLVNPDNLYKLANAKVSQLHLHQSLPSTINLMKLLNNLTNLKVLDLSYNNMGPQAFRAVCLAMSNNMNIISLNLSDNRADTDSASCIGMMLKENKTLQYLDVSGNNLGKDYFSRCVGPALKTNSSLTTLRAESIGSVDMKLLLESLQENTSLEDINISNNQISDRTCIGKHLATCLQSTSTKLYSINISNCNISPDGIKLLLQGLQQNTTLSHLNISGNEFGNLQTLYEVLLCCLQHKNLKYLSINDARLSDTAIQRKDIQSSTVSSLEILKLNSSKLTNEIFSILSEQLSGKVTSLTELDIGNNPELKITCLTDIYRLTNGDNKNSSIHRLSYGLNDIEGRPIAEYLKTNWSQLNYLSLRKCKVSVAGLTCLSTLVQNKDLPITTLVLDGLKLSGTQAFTDFCSSLSTSHITALSFDGCQLADEDLVPLCQAMMKGFKLHMLKLSANRLTDEFTSTFVKSLLTVSNYPLAVLDLSNNQLNNKTASELSLLFSSKGHKTLHSVNLQSNYIGYAGIKTIVSCITPTSVLKTLYIDKQRGSFEESEINDIGMIIAAKLGYKVNIKDNTIETGCSPLPNILQYGIHINISSLGGHTGDIIYKLDCPAIVTDLSSRQLLYLTFSQVMEMTSCLKGYKKGECILSNEEFDIITGSNKDREVPSWLQLSEKRDVGLYLSNLPGNATVNKLEAIFDMEADCSVDEICLMKDPVTRNNNGIGWVLMSDVTSVEKAVRFFQQGEAKIFGQPFMISRIQLKLHDADSLEAEQKARQDMEERMKQRKIDEAAHRQLILHNTEESWKRHAYRLAHPAYADGRIW